MYAHHIPDSTAKGDSVVNDQNRKPHQAVLSCSRDMHDAGGDVTARYWTIREELSSLNIQPVMDDDEDDDFDHIYDEDTKTFSFKYHDTGISIIWLLEIWSVNMI